MSTGVNDSHIIQVDLEDRRNKELRDPDALLAYIDSRIQDNDMHYILLDEVQHVPEFEDVLNSYLKIDNADENLINREKISARKLTFWYLKNDHSK